MPQDHSLSLLNWRTGAGLRLNSIQYLRAVAATAVVVYHAANSLLGQKTHLINLDYGTYGVDIFFVVSGFVMYYTTFGTAIRPGTFFVKRLIRIFPLYFILSTAMFAMVLLSPSSFNHESPDFLAYFESIFFIPHWNPLAHDLQPIIGQGWTLNNEMFFYVLFAASLFLRHRLSGIAVLPVICALVGLGYIYPVESPASITYTSPLMLEFCLGIVVAASFIIPEKPSLLTPAGLMVLLGAGTTYLYIFHADSRGSELLRPFFVGLPCALIVAGLVAAERYGRLPPNSPFFSLVGDASYSLYLVHGFVISFGKRIWQHFGVTNSVVSHTLYIGLVLVASVATALLIYRLLERNLARNLNAALLPRTRDRSAATDTPRVVISK